MIPGITLFVFKNKVKKMGRLKSSFDLQIIDAVLTSAQMFAYHFPLGINTVKELSLLTSRQIQ